MKKELTLLDFAWETRLKLHAEGAKLHAEGAKLRAEGAKLHAEGAKFYAEGNKLHAERDKRYAEGDKLHAEGDKLWAEAIIAVYGNIKLEWVYREDKSSYACVLEIGQGKTKTFEP